MKKLFRLSLPVLAIFSLSSCALPPREAWRVIQHDGLLPYLSVELGKRPVPKYVKLSAVAGSRFVTLTSSAKMPGPAGGGGVYVRPLRVLVSNRYLDSSPAPRRAWQSALAAPARREMAAVAPKPAPHPIVSAPVARPAPRVVASAPVARPAPRVVADAPVTKPLKPVEVEITPAPKVSAAPPIAAEKPKAKPVVPAPSASPDAGGVVNVKAVAGEMPFGSPIAGRPGLVNSPFAGKYQLVDVTGLNPGQEVKCPYTGKLFRVPGVQQATNGVKPLTEPPPPPATKP